MNYPLHRISLLLYSGLLRPAKSATRPPARPDKTYPMACLPSSGTAALGSGFATLGSSPTTAALAVTSTATARQKNGGDGQHGCHKEYSLCSYKRSTSHRKGDPPLFCFCGAHLRYHYSQPSLVA